MNINTLRVVNKEITGRIKDEKKLKCSQEYFVLAFLKYKFPGKYKDVIKAEKPDLQGEKVFVEVTTLETYEDMQANKEFAKFCEDHDEQRATTIEKTGNALRYYAVTDFQSLDNGGGYNFEYDRLLLDQRVCEKIKKAEGYDKKNRTPELALVKNDRPLLEWLEKIDDSLEAIVNNQETYETIYILFPEGCIYIEKGKSPQKVELSQEEYSRLKTIGRMTAEEEIRPDDEEWK